MWRMNFQVGRDPSQRDFMMTPATRVARDFMMTHATQVTSDFMVTHATPSPPVYVNKTMT